MSARLDRKGDAGKWVDGVCQCGLGNLDDWIFDVDVDETGVLCCAGIMKGKWGRGRLGYGTMTARVTRAKSKEAIAC